MCIKLITPLFSRAQKAGRNRSGRNEMKRISNIRSDATPGIRQEAKEAGAHISPSFAIPYEDLWLGVGFRTIRSIICNTALKLRCTSSTLKLQPHRICDRNGTYTDVIRRWQVSSHHLLFVLMNLIRHWWRKVLWYPAMPLALRAPKPQLITASPGELTKGHDSERGMMQAFASSALTEHILCLWRTKLTLTMPTGTQMSSTWITPGP